MKPDNAAHSRFFAITGDRLEAITAHNLTRSEILVWAAVETKSAPERARTFNLEHMAQALRIGVDSVRRALRRLIGLGLIVGSFKRNRHSLAPASRTKISRAGNQSPIKQPCASARFEEDNPAPVQGLDVGNQVLERVTGDHIEKDPEIKKLSGKKVTDSTVRQLVQAWGLYPAVARTLVNRFGVERVTQVMAWGSWLRQSGKLRSSGWVYRALVGGWVVPDGFQRERQTLSDPTILKKLNHVRQREAVAPIETIENKIETIRQMSMSSIPAVRRLSERFKAEWGLA